jgi:hypothetical protein
MQPTSTRVDALTKLNKLLGGGNCPVLWSTLVVNAAFQDRPGHVLAIGHSWVRTSDPSLVRIVTTTPPSSGLANLCRSTESGSEHSRAPPSSPEQSALPIALPPPDYWGGPTRAAWPYRGAQLGDALAQRASCRSVTQGDLLNRERCRPDLRSGRHPGGPVRDRHRQHHPDPHIDTVALVSRTGRAVNLIDSDGAARQHGHKLVAVDRLSQRAAAPTGDARIAYMCGRLYDAPEEHDARQCPSTQMPATALDPTRVRGRAPSNRIPSSTRWPLT